MLLILTVLINTCHPNLEDNKRSSSLHPCDRKCSKLNSNKTCYFKFKIQKTFTGSLGCRDCIAADGRRTILNVYNSEMPGPPINVCLGDTIVADVTNELLEPSALHWHGIQHRNTPWMDGAQYLTQYPIQPSETIQYKFEADIPGTFLYHSHFSEQRALGSFGSLVIRTPRDPAEYIYDVDNNVIFLNDWFYDGNIYKAQNVLINGLGQRQSHSRDLNKVFTESRFSEFSVKKGLRYRFRAIYTSNTNCTLEISVDNHNLTLISSDGFDFKPITVESFGMTSGERFDFIINANQKVRTYWIRVRGNYACGGMVQGAVLRYEGVSNSPNTSSLNEHYELNGVQINPTVNDRNSKDLSTDKLQSLEPWKPTSIYPTYYMNITLRDKGKGKFDFFLNEIYYSPETRFSLLQVKDIIPYSKYYCNASRFEAEGVDCTERKCKCPNLINFPCRRFVEIFFFNPTEDVHPMHLHGYEFRVVGFGRLPHDVVNTFQIKQFDQENPFPRNYNFPLQKDNIQIPSLGGYTIIQMFTDNPGFWAMHCHTGSHSKLGMFAIFQVCDPEEMKTVPEFAYCQT